MIIDARDCWDAAKVNHNTYFDISVKSRLAKKKSKFPIPIFDFLTANHDNIRDGSENEFRRIHAEYRKIYDTLSAAGKTRTTAALKSIYNYSSFIIKHEVNWCAYKLCESLSVLTCPYCNLSYGHTLSISSSGVVRPTLDHFFDKATYPLFAISLGNLVASCYSCNSSLKGTKNFFTSPHLNPLDSQEKIKILMDFDILARHDLRVIDNSNIKLIFDNQDIRAKNSVKTFYLQERYQFLVDEARFIAKNMQIYTTIAPDPVRLEWLKRGVTDKNYRDRVLGKMIKDFSETYL